MSSPCRSYRAICRIMDPAQVSKTEVLKQLLPGWETGLGALVVFGVICWLVFRVRAYLRDDADGDASPDEMLAQFRESQREGVLSEEEYRLIKRRLVQSIAPTTVTERRESAEQSTDSVKGFADLSADPEVDGKHSTEMDQPR